ncbi:MAG TPA: TIGR03013 family XrtA/PEP-CTERM system glycosyltransferase [Planctomycetota bacterium]|nr:TIGR03013 family XrtA/PEP-CTERM system glycosyltransferase [Planctomycetota bacterium]
MLRVLRHYLPMRRALLVFSETALLYGVLAAGLSMHLLRDDPAVAARILHENLSRSDALDRCLISAFLLALLSQLAIAFNELYDFRVSVSRYDRAARFVASGGSAVAAALGAVLLARAWKLERVLDFPGLALSQLVQALVFTMLLGFGLLYLWRHLFHFALRRWNFNQRVLILGAGPAARSLAREMLERSDSGYEAIGMLPEAPLDTEAPRRAGGASAAAAVHGLAAAPAAAATVPEERAARFQSAARAEGAAPAALLLEPIPLARGAELAPGGNGHRGKPLAEPLFDLVVRLKVDLVVIALQDRRDHLPIEELLRCRLHGIPVKEREALYEQITGRIAVESLRPSYLIFNDGFSRSPRTEIIKRAVDMTLAAAGLAITLPAMLAVAIAVRLDSRGPVLFAQERVGRDGLPFTLYKFRSMKSDAEEATGPVWASADDPRITRVGRFLRRIRLDELPQLFNVLAGHMSLVGPRPERPVFVEDLARQIPYYHQRHIVKPGLTGWAQINYPYGNTVEDALQKLQYDLFYIKNQSLLFDLSIVFTTIKTVVLRRGT